MVQFLRLLGVVGILRARHDERGRCTVREFLRIFVMRSSFEHIFGPMRQMASGVLLALAVAGCGGGGGGDSDGSTRTPTPNPTPPSGIGGSLIVPPDQMLEVEPNDEPRSAQAMRQGATIAGAAARGDAGFAVSGLDDVVIEDLFRLTTVGPVRVTLTIGANDLLFNDLDLILFDESGVIIDLSEGLIATEVVEAPRAGTYLVGVRAFEGSSTYTLSASDTAPAGPSASAKVSSD